MIDAIVGRDYGPFAAPEQLRDAAAARSLDRRPVDDLGEWDEVFSTGMVIDAGLGYQSPVDHDVTFDVPPGCYALLICGRGFVNRGWPGSTTPGDRWRIQLWPAVEPPPPARIKRWQQPA